MTVEWQVRGPEYEEYSSGMRIGDCVYVETPVGIPCMRFVFDDPRAAQQHMEALDKAAKAAVSIEIIAI